MRRFSLGLRLATLVSLAIPVACGSDSNPAGVQASTSAVVVSLGVSSGATLTVGQSIQAVAALRDASGNDVTAQSVTWSASDPTVAVVSTTGLVTAVAPGTVSINAVVSGQSGSVALTVRAVPVAAVAVSFSAPAVIGRQLMAAALTRDANSNVLLGRTVSWSSSNTNIATVTSAGAINPLAVGTTVITATSEGVSGGASLTVQATSITAVAVTLAAPTMSLGVTTTASAAVRDDANSVVANPSVLWSSSNVSVAAVSAAGLVTAFTPGTATISATVGGVVGGATVVVFPPVVSLSVSLGTNPVGVTKTTTATATVLDGGGNVLTGHAVAWSSSNPAVATVAQDGTVTAVAAGTATISASSETRTGSVDVSVQAGVGSVSVSVAASPVRVGQTTLASALVRDATNNVLSGHPVTWSTSNSGVATVGSDGTVRGVAVGATNVIGTADGISGSTSIAVIAPNSIVPTQLGIATQPSSATTGATLPVAVVVQIRDASGAVDASATNVISASVSSGGGVLSGTTSVPPVNGVATFSNLRVNGIGTQTLLFTASGLIPTTSAGFVLGPVAGPTNTPPAAPLVVTEPAYDPSTSRLIMADSMENYTSAAAMGAVSTNRSPRIVPISSPNSDGGPVDVNKNQVIAPGHGGTGHALRLYYDGGYQTATNWATQNTVNQPVGTTHFFTYWARVHFNGPITAPVAVKWFEAWHINSQSTREEWATHDHLPWTGGVHRTYWGVVDQGSTTTQGYQPVGPYFEEDINDGQWHRFTYEYRANTSVISGSLAAGNIVTSRDGIARMWVDGVKVIDVSGSAIGVTPPGGEKPWCNVDDVDKLASNDGVSYARWGSTQTNGPGQSQVPQVLFVPWTLDIDDFVWWVSR